MCEPCRERIILRAAKALARSPAARCIDPDAEMPWLPFTADGQRIVRKGMNEPLRDVEARELRAFMRAIEEMVVPGIAEVQSYVRDYQGDPRKMVDSVMSRVRFMGPAIVRAVEAAALPYASLMANAGASAAIASLPSQILELDQLVRFTGEDFFGANPLAVQAARNSAGRMAQSLWGGVSDRISAAIGDGIAQGLPIRDIAGLIEEYGFDSTRAEMIARTESAFAYTGGQIEAWKQTGVVVGKRWVLSPDACEFCEAAADEYGDNPVGLDETFYDMDDSLEGADGGALDFSYRNVDGPPLHPNCRCAMLAEIDPKFLQ
jgi:hypothetical protein